ncbi:MAG: hypothetical protein KC503_22360, partial [Myxococcales bacterium]|nr:hypothetical protein [Myxococcales bacterium]
MQPHRHLVTRPPRALPLLLAALLAAGCSGTPADEQPAALPSAAIFAPLGEPLRSLDDAALARFEAGRRAMSRRFSAAEGLGPRFNATSCAACHERPVVGGSASRYRNVFVLAGAADAIVRVQQQFAVGARGRADDIAAGGGGGGGGGDGARTVTRNPMPLFGLGLIAELPVDVITENADPLDADGDGISGRVNFERGFVGRFGRKAQMASLSGVIRLALRDHLGLTSGGIGAHVDPQPSPVNLPTADDDGVADPEVSSAHVEALIAFVSGLAAPPPDAPTPASERGRALFARVGCTGCHKPALVGPRGALPLYSDLLLHDMGDALGDGVQVGVAEAREFRTQPLWGLSATGPYLHDGRADTIAGAILLHGGEAARAREAYVALAPDERADVLSF